MILNVARNSSLKANMIYQIEALEAIAGVMGYGFETSNKYKIKNSLGQVGLIVTHFFNSDQSCIAWVAISKR